MNVWLDGWLTGRRAGIRVAHTRVYFVGVRWY